MPDLAMRPVGSAISSGVLGVLWSLVVVAVIVLSCCCWAGRR
jgi:hypothetical protein